jgi:hypothetical protein
VSVTETLLLRQQLDYYRARAREYDQWWLRLGRYNRGHVLNTKWFTEAAVVSSALSKFRPVGRVLDSNVQDPRWAPVCERRGS